MAIPTLLYLRYAPRTDQTVGAIEVEMYCVVGDFLSKHRLDEGDFLICDTAFSALSHLRLFAPHMSQAFDDLVHAQKSGFLFRRNSMIVLQVLKEDWQS